jgi:hypothetical protein
VSAVTIRLVSPTARMLAEHLMLERAFALLESYWALGPVQNKEL